MLGKGEFKESGLIERGWLRDFDLFWKCVPGCWGNVSDWTWKTWIVQKWLRYFSTQTHYIPTLEPKKNTLPPFKQLPVGLPTPTPPPPHPGNINKTKPGQARLVSVTGETLKRTTWRRGERLKLLSSSQQCSRQTGSTTQHCPSPVKR